MKPAFRLVVNGQNITPRIQQCLVGLTLTDERADKADTLEIQLDDSNGQLAIPPRKASVQLWLGWDNDLVDKGSYTLDEIEYDFPPNTLTLRARSADFKGGLKTKREQSWHGLTLGDMLTSVAKRNGLTPAIHTELAQQWIEHIDQTNESDLNLIKRLGQHYDAIANIKAGRLLFSPVGLQSTLSGIPIAPVVIHLQQCSRGRYHLSDRESDYTGVQANWNEKKHGTLRHEVAGDASNPKVLRHTYRSATEARTAAQAEWAKLQRGAQQLNLLLSTGNPRISPETPLQLAGFKPQLQAIAWHTVRVVHRLNDGEGLVTEIESETLGGEESAQ